MIISPSVISPYKASTFQSGGAPFVGLLDLYPSAAAAYSVRLLKSDYAGALVEIRRSSDNALKDFYPDSNNELSLSSEDGSGTSLSSWITTDDGFVRTWYDQSGNGLDTTQTTTSRQPQLLSVGALLTDNGKAGLDFSVNDLAALTEATLSISQPYSSSVVVNYATNSNDKYIYSQRPLGTGRSNIGKSNATTKFFIHSGSNSGAVGDAITERQYGLFAIHDGASSELSINGSNTTGLSAGTNSKDGLSIGNFKSPNSSFDYNWEGLIQELVFWSGDKASDRPGIETNKNDYYTIY